MKQQTCISKAKQGFSLVTVLLLVALLTIILVAFSALLNISLTSSENAELRAQARQNAVAAMGMALGELQKDMGPDQRVSAMATLFDNDPTTQQIEGVNQPFWTGVWKTTRTQTGTNGLLLPAWSGSDVPSNYYSSGSSGFKSQNFVRWLVSAPSTGSGDTTLADQNQDLPKTASLDDSNSVILVGNGSVKSGTALVSSGSIEVRAWKLDGDKDYAGRQGRYAWWVGDEGVKAKINLESPVSGTASTLQLQQALAASPRNAVEAVQTYQGYSTQTGDATKAVTFGSLPWAYKNVGNPGDFSNAFFDFTTYSQGVLADVQNGGLRKDLNLLLELPTSQLPAFVYNQSAGNGPNGVSLYPFQPIYYRPYTDSLGNVYPSPSYDPSNPASANKAMGPDWGLVYRYYNLYKSPYLYQDTDGVYTFYFDRYNAEVLYSGARDCIIPQTLKSQYLYGFFYRGGQNYEYPTVQNSGTYQPPPTYSQLYLSCVPVVHLWNPYNVRLRNSTTAENTTGYPSLGANAGRLAGEVISIPSKSISISFDGGSTWRDLLGTSDATSVFQPYGGSLCTIWLASGNASSVGLPFKWNPGSVQVFGIEQLSTSGTITELDTKYYKGHYQAGNPTTLRSPTRAYNLVYGYYSTYLGMYINALINTGDLRVPNSGGAVSYQIRFNASSLSQYAAGRSLFEEGERTDSGLYPNGPTRILGVPEFNTANQKYAVTSDTNNAYQTLSLTTTPTQYAQAPGMAFCYDVTFKAYPQDFLRKSKYSLISDPLEKSYVILGGDTVANHVAPFEISIVGLKGSALTGGATDLNNNKIVPVDSTNRNGYFGNVGQSVTSNVVVEFPTTPLNSLVQLQNVALGRDYSHPIYKANDIYNGYNSATALEPMGATFFRALGNSYAHPMIPANAIAAPAGSIYSRSYDHSFYANNTFWDSYYFSGIAPEIPITSSGNFSSGSPSPRTVRRTVQDVLNDFLSSSNYVPLSTLRLRPWISSKYTASNLVGSLADGSGNPLAGAYTRSASWLMADGAFNVNSTSVDAWTAVLATNFKQKAPYMPLTSAGSVFPTFTATGVPFFRIGLFNNAILGSSGYQQGYWNSFRQLQLTDLKTLAQKLVEQIKRRGPFLSLAEFVNRQISDDQNLNQSGAMQTAIDNAGLNNDLTSQNPTADTTVNWPANTNPGAASGSVATGAQGFLMQADVLKPLAAILSARSDTFVIRSYGEVVVNGKVTSRAWCEAIVQRTPEYVDQSDPALSAKNPTDNISVGDAATLANLNDTNKKFGRRFHVIQFRWLNKDEI